MTLMHYYGFSPAICAALEEHQRQIMHAKMSPVAHMLVPESIRPALMEALRHMADTTQSTSQRERALVAIDALGGGA